MPLRKSLCAAFALATALLGLAPPAAAVWPVNPNTNLPVCTAAGKQFTTPGVAPDGSGGAIVTWTDQRYGTNDVFAQHVLAGGYADPLWPVDGVGIVSIAYSSQGDPKIVTDGAGGGLVVWDDNRLGGSTYPLYAARVRGNGTLDPAWPANGRLLSSANGNQYDWECISDGAGGVAIAWQENRGASGNDIYVQRVSSAGALSWGASGLLACGVTGSQAQPALCTDLAGGAVVAWYDDRNGTGEPHIYATRVLANGTLDWRWLAGGVPLCTASGGQVYPATLSDGSGGAFVAWMDYRINPPEYYVQHVFANGTLDPAWPVNGRRVHGTAGLSIAPVLVTDGSGGLIMLSADSLYVVNRVLASGTVDPAWPAGGVHLPATTVRPSALSDHDGGMTIVGEDIRTGTSIDIYAHRVRSNGVFDPAWPVGGRAVSTAAFEQTYLGLADDGYGGAIAAWIDGRNRIPDANNYDIYAQRVRKTGVLGVPEPHIASARDVRGDQGGRLLLAWGASEGDAAPNPYVGRYHLWRKVDASVAATRAAAARANPPDGYAAALPALRPGDIRSRADATGSTWWEFIATVPGSQMPNYAYTVPTTADSLPGWIPWNVFVVDAEDNSAWAFYSSPADSGYSADNLAPHFPAPDFGQYTQGFAKLWWPRSPEPDFAVYRLYRGSRNDFVPGPQTLVATLTDTSYIDYAGAPYYYILQAVDVHGNASPNALIVPDGALDADGPAAPKALAFRGAQPNPARVAARFAFDLPAASDVRITVFDVSGRRVRELRWNDLPAGSHRLAWDGRDASGGVAAAGLYLARFEACGVARQSRFVLVR
jgi:hypothetical protein